MEMDKEEAQKILGTSQSVHPSLPTRGEDASAAIAD
jgi:hypothetical protein